MKKVTVRVAELIEKIAANRSKHIAEYKEACADYKQDALEEVEKAVSRLRDAIEGLQDGEMMRLAGVSFSLPYPENHEEDYDQAITMLQMSVDDQIEIEAEEFAQYAMDRWDWRGRFDAIRMSYSNKSMVR